MTFSPPPIAGKTDIPGLMFDFNYGARVQVPQGDYHVRLIDRDAALTLYDADANGAVVSSTKKYYVRFGIEVYEKTPKEGGKPDEKELKLIISHDYDCRGKNVLMKFPEAALGDMLAWFPYAEAFRFRSCLVGVPCALSSGIKKGADAPIFLFPGGGGRFWWLSPLTLGFINDVVVDHAVLDGP